MTSTSVDVSASGAPFVVECIEQSQEIFPAISFRLTFKRFLLFYKCSIFEYDSVVVAITPLLRVFSIYRAILINLVTNFSYLVIHQALR